MKTLVPRLAHPRLACVFAVAFAIPWASLGQIEVPGGVLAVDTLWDDTTQPYIVDNLSQPVIVPAGVVLTVAPGVTVQSLYDNKGSLLVQGTLAATEASFEMLTRDVVAQPIIVEGNGMATFTGCSLTVDRSSGDPSATTALIVAKGASNLTLAGSELSNSAGGANANRGVWMQDTATLVVADDGGTPTTFSGFPEAILLQSTTAAAIADADFSTGTYGIVLDNPAVDLTVADSTFTDYEQALRIPNAKDVTLTNIGVDQTGAIDTQTGVHMNTYTSLTISGAISNMNVGVHVSTAHSGQDVSGVVFTNCNWDLLAEGDWNPGGNRTVAVDTTLPVAHYHVDNPVTIPAGVTLTILPGTILDVKDRYQSMFVVDGTLDAEGAIFQPDLEVWDHVAYVRNSGVVNLTDCLFDVSGNSTSGDAYYHTGSCVYAANDAVVNVVGGIFRTGPRWVDESMRCFTVVDNAELNLGDNGGERVRIEGFKRAVVFDSLVDAHFDGVDLVNCVIAVDTNTLANLFAYRLDVQGCGTGLKLRDIGVLVTDEVVCSDTRDAISLSWNQVTSPQIGTTGITFGPESYCVLPGNYTLDRTITMRAMPYRIRVNEGVITVPAGKTLTFPAGSEVAGFDGGHGFDVYGTLNATETLFNFETSGWWNTRIIRFYDDAVATFTQCRFYGNEIQYNNTTGVQLLRLEGNADVLVRGCTFDGNRGSALGRNQHAMVVENNASARFESYGGTPCSFADFNYAIYSRDFSTFPYVDIDSTIDNCGVGAMVATNDYKTVDTDVEITCPWLTLDAHYSVTVEAGASLTFMPGTHLRVNSYRDTGFIFVDGTLRFDGASLDADAWHNDAVFVVRNSGRLELIDTSVDVSTPNYDSSSSRLIEATDTSSILMDNAAIVTTAVRNWKTKYALVIQSPTVQLSVPASRGGETRLEGFGWSAIYAEGLQPLAGTPNLVFADNYRDILVSGAYTLGSNLTLPPNTHLQFETHRGPATIGPGATLTIPAGCRIGNHYHNDTPKHTLVVQGAIQATGARFTAKVYRYDDTTYGGNDDGSDFIRLAGSGTGTFTSCTFETYDSYHPTYWPPKSRVFDIGGGSSLHIRGCTFETPPTWASGRVDNAIRVHESANLTVEPFGAEPSVLAGFYEAIAWESGLGSLTLRDSILRGNDTALRTTQFPLAHTISGNTFVGSSTWALDNQSAGRIDVRDNFWGHPSGPQHPTNPFGQGDAINGDVLFLPYLSQGDVEIAGLGNHSLGQAPNAFGMPGDVPDALLLRFGLGGTSEPTHVFGLTVRITGRDGFTEGMLANVRLVADANEDGALDAGDTLLASGTVDLAGNRISFELEDDLEGDFLVVADVSGLESGDTLSLGLTADDVVHSPSQFVGGSCSDANHYLNRLVMAGHPAGNFANAFLAAPEQTGLRLLGFHLNEGYEMRSLDIGLGAMAGLDRANISHMRLLVDDNNNGREDFGEAWYTANPITVSGATGTVHFAFGATPVPTGRSFVLFGDFVKLHREDTLTLTVAADGVDAGDGVVVAGSAPSSTHAVPAPLMLIDAPFQVANGFVAASQLNDVPLLSFTLTPGGRRIEGLTFDLYDVQGMPAASITDARIVADINQNGQVDSGETTTVGGVGIPAIDPATGTGTLHFGGSFLTEGGDYILVADIANLENDDTFTITLTSEGLAVPANEMVEGGVSPVRHAVYRPDLPQAARQTNWTLSYRSPGGLGVTGAYSHDDRKIVVGYSSGTAFTFEADSNTPQTMFHKHFDKVQYAGFSADDSEVITVTRDGAVYVWDAVTAAMKNNLFSDLLVRYAVPSPDAAKLFIVTEGKALLLDMITGDIVWEFVLGTDLATSQLYAADYAPDGSMILVGAADKRAYLLDAGNGSIIRYYQGHSQAVTGATFAANGAIIMTSSTDSTVALWHIGDNVNPIANVTLDGQKGLGSGVSRDGARVAVLTELSGTRRLRMFDDTGLELWNTTLPYTHFTGSFSSIRFNSAGDRVLICSNANSDWNWPAALAVQYSATDGSFIGFVGPRGRVQGWWNEQTYERPRVSEDGNRIFYMHSEGLDVIFPQPGRKIIEFSDISNEDSFDITPDGRKLVYTHAYAYNNIWLRYFAVDSDRMTLISETRVNRSYDPLTLSKTGGLTILGDSIYRTLTGSEYTNSPNPDGAYRSAFSPDESLWGIAFYDDKSIKTMFVGDETGSLEYGVTLTDPYKPVKILYHPDGERVGCVDEYAGVQFYRLDDNTPVGLYDYRSGGGVPRLNDAALSHDGTMLAIARGNSVKLFDMRTGRVLRYFYPTHSGQADCRAYSVGFGERDNMLWIGWGDAYVEIFHRSRVTGLRINPVARTLPVGRSQEYTVKALYDDGSSVDVTPEYVYRATGTELAPGARIYANPAEFATIEAGTVTVNQGAGGGIGLTAVYTEGGRTVTAAASLTVGQSSLATLFASPAALSLSPGVLTPIDYTAVFTDGYREDVTGETVLTTDSPDDVRIVGNNVTVLPDAPVGDIEIYGTYEYDGVAKTATTVISVHGPESRWERDVVTPGGDTHALAYSPNGQLLAVGSSSGAVSLYAVGATTTQYELSDVIAAHQRPVSGVHFRSDTALVTVGRDGRICQWDVGGRGAQTTEFQHEAVIMAEAVYESLLVFGDNLGRVVLFDLDANEVVWSRQRHDGPLTAVAINATHILSGGEDRKLYLLERADGDAVMTYSAFAKPPVDCWFRGGQMIVLSGDKRLARWDTGTEDGNLREFFFPSAPTALTIRSDGSMYVATAANGANAVWVYDANGLLTRWLDVPPSMGTIASLAVTPAGSHIVTGRASDIVEVETEMGTEEKISAFHSVQFWDLNRGSYSGSLAHSHSLNDARISADGSMLFTQSARRVYRWGLQTGRGHVLSATKFLETGYFTPYDFANLELSAAAGLVGTRVRSSIYLMHAAERLLHMSVHTDATHFGISPDGARMITNTAGPLTRFWDVSLDFPTVTAEHATQSADVAFIDNEDSLGSIPDNMFVRIFNELGLGYSGITVIPPGAAPGEPDLGGEMAGPRLENLSVSGNGNRVAVVIRYVETDMLGGTTSHNYVQVYDISDRMNSARIFDTYLGSVEGDIPPVAVALSDDGALLFYGMAKQDGEGHLHDLTDNRELMLFLPPSAGTLSNIGPAAAQFADGDGALMIAWAEGYAEVFRREGLDTLRLAPAARSVAAGETLDMTAWVAYADGAEIDVTGRTTFMVASGPATVNGGVVTVDAAAAPGAVVVVTGTYTELDSTVQGTATLTVQDALFTHLSIDPPKISMIRGQSVTARVFAHFADASVFEVSTAGDLVWTLSPVNGVQRDGNLLTIPDQAQYGDVFVTARLIRDGDEHQVTMAVHIRQEGAMVNPGDFDGSLKVDFNDLIYFIGHYGETSASPNWDSRCDFDGDGDVDIDDATAFIALYGTDYTPSRTAAPANLLVAARDSAGAASVWLEAPAGDMQVGDVFEVLVYAQDNHPEARGFRGGPITILFDPGRMEFAGTFDPAAVLQPPFDSLFAEGVLKTDRIERLTGLTIADGCGDGEPVLYARLPFRATTAGLAVFETAPSTCGLALTPPVGKLTMTSTEFSGDAVVVVDLGGGDGSGEEVEIVFHLLEGWNLVGIPLHVDATRGGVAREGLQFYAWSGSNYQRTTEVMAGLAYWVHSDQPRQLVVRGFPREATGLPLRKGWNLIAPLADSPAELPLGVQAIYSWKPDRAQFGRPDQAATRGEGTTCKPGEGFWVLCTEDGVILWPNESNEPVDSDPRR